MKLSISPFSVWFNFAIRARIVSLFSAAKSFHQEWGKAMESKKEKYMLIPSQLHPKTII